MSEPSSIENITVKPKIGRPPGKIGKRMAAQLVQSEIITFRVTRSNHIAIQFTANYFGQEEADWIRTILLANVIQQGKPLPVLPTPPTPVVEGVQL